MALLLRRGTQAQRDEITPAEGELIYTTDTKRLYAGDGATPGGELVSQAVAATTLSSLADTDTTLIGNNNVLVYYTSTSKWMPASVLEINVTGNLTGNAAGAHTGTLDGDVTGSVFADNSTILVDGVNGNIPANVLTGTASINVTGNTTGLHTGIVDGDLTGSVFGDDSTVLVDGINNTVVGNINNALVLTEQVTVNSSSASGTVISSNAVTAGGNGPNLDFFGSRVSLDSPIVLEPGDSVIDIAVNGWDGAAQTTAAVIKMGPDKYTGSIASGVMPGRIVFLTYNESGATGINNALVFNRFGNLGIGTDAPAEKLDVQGNIVASGTIQPGVYADATARDTALTAPTAGQMVYITDIAKFQGNTDGTITGWANLN
jgi:hypothetical protein